jgi:hypothetical protein
VLQFEDLPEGTQFRLMRVALGLTLFQVGAAATVSPPRLSEYERGRGALPPDAVVRVHKFLVQASEHQHEGQTADGIA